MAEETSKKFSRNYVQWTREMDSALLAVLVEHHNNGDHAQNGWKAHVYTAAIKAVRDNCGVVVTKEKIVSRCKTFDKHYEILSKILALSGFGWDNEKNILSVDSEDVWNRYVEANEKAAIYKTKVVYNWDEICIIYSKDHATGEGATTGAETAANAQPEDNDISPESVEPAPKRQRPCDAIMCMLGDMKTTFTDALKTTEPLAMPQITSPVDILAALRNIEGLSHSDRLRAYGKLIHSERMFQALLELPIDDRKEWLLMSI